MENVANYKKIYDNQYFYAFLMDVNQKFFNTVFIHSGFSRDKYIIEKEADVATFSRFDSEQYINAFDPLKAYGLEKFVEGLVELSNGGVSHGFPLEKISARVSIEGERIADEYSPVTLSFQIDGAIYKISFFVSMQIEIVYEGRHVFFVPIDELSMASRIACLACIHAMVQEYLQKMGVERNITALKNGLESGFPMDNIVSLKMIPPFIIRSLTQASGYDGIVAVTKIDVTGQETVVLKLVAFSFGEGWGDGKTWQEVVYEILFEKDPSGDLSVRINSELDSIKKTVCFMFMAEWFNSFQDLEDIVEYGLNLVVKRTKSQFVKEKKRDIMDYVSVFFSNLLGESKKTIKKY